MRRSRNPALDEARSLIQRAEKILPLYLKASRLRDGAVKEISRVEGPLVGAIYDAANYSATPAQARKAAEQASDMASLLSMYAGAAKDLAEREKLLERLAEKAFDALQDAPDTAEAGQLEKRLGVIEKALE